MTAVEAAALLELLRRRRVVVTQTVQIRRSRDPDDDKFLECAGAGGADYLVSADTDLLSLREVERIPIVDVPTFWLPGGVSASATRGSPLPPTVTAFRTDARLAKAEGRARSDAPRRPRLGPACPE